MKIVEFSLRRRVTVSMVVVVIVILGLISFSQLGLDMFPEIDAPYISVVTTYSGVSSEDIEQNITRPLEQWVSTVSRVKQIKSISQEGTSVIMVEFESGTNLDFAAQDIRDKIGLFENFLPEGAKKPLVVKFNFEDMPILMYGITGSKKRDLKSLKDHLDKEVSARLERLDGVASAMLFSPEEAEILINVDKGRLEARGLSITQVERAIQASNINLPSGYLDEKYSEYLLRTIGEFEKVKEIDDVVVGIGQQGEPIFLRDIADIREANKDIRSLVRINGTSGLMLIVTKSHGANTVLVAREVKKHLEEIKSTLEKDLDFSVALDFSRIIEIMAGRSSSNILVGGLLAMLLILFFLRSLRPTLAIGIAIPLSVITTFIAMRVTGYTLNLITMGGLALGVGMMVDNAIVVIENIFRHLEEGKKPFEAASVGTSEVGLAITASTLTTIAVFFPMMFATGIAGVFSKGLAIAVAFSLLSSLFVALTIIPMLAAWFFKSKKISHDSAVKEDTLMDLGRSKFVKLREFYRKLLTRTLKKRLYVLLGAIALFICAIGLAALLGAEFLPDTDRSMIFLKLKMPVGTNLPETNRVIKYLENRSLNDPNVITTMVNVGLSEQNAQDSASGFNPEGSYEATLWAYLTTSSQRELSDRQILEQWRQYFPELQTSKIQFVDIAATSMGMSTTSPIEFNLFGRNLTTLKHLAERVSDVVQNIRGIRDVQISLSESKPEIRMKIKKEEASRLGLTPYEISRQVQTYTIGTVVSRMMMEGEERDIRVRLKEKDRDTVEALKKLPIVTPLGVKVFLSQVVEFEKSLGTVKIYRENQIRKVSVTGNYIGRDLGGLVGEIMEKTRSITDELPPGYFSQMGGAYKDMKEAFITMFFALLLSIVLVYAVMASQFENLKYPFIIMFTIPMAFIGVAVFLALTGKNINLPVFMGFIMLSGIAVNNGIVMVDYINQLIRHKQQNQQEVSMKEKLEAVINGAVVRLRPILITALSTICGMLPMALATSEGAEMRSPMAIAIIGGLTAATFLTLFIVPILYTYFSKIKVNQ
jgi:HAE1 family hydrophobic/amphiphilic exporter-1